jgi:uncharacterized protein (DUF488 family)
MSIDNNSGNVLTVFTIGHSNVPDSVIVGLLNKFSVHVLVDIRSSPYSQYCPQFNRETFQKTLQRANIEYRYLGNSLGGRPKDASCYKNGRIAEAHADYLHLVDYSVVMEQDSFTKGIDDLCSLAAQYTLAILCSEEDPQNCHRHHLVGKYLVENKGVQVLHIRGDGSIIRDQQLKDLVAELQVTQDRLF